MNQRPQDDSALRAERITGECVTYVEGFSEVKIVFIDD